MNINATEDDLRTAAEALKLASILDDRAPRGDKARTAAWAEKIHHHRLTRNDVLDGLQAFYDGPSDRAIQIGDLIHHARIIKRDRLSRRDEPEYRRQPVDNKSADELRALSAAFLSGRVGKRTPRLDAAEMALQTCYGKRESMAAIREYFDAKAEAKGKVRAGLAKGNQP